ncbi:type IV secretory system conjugative DNA transfer family protein [Paenibacillus elgii]|uniref:type IV secretory system conjugative DNA transfer family protein n=1 Tax=Paenibacillus elgii TaxID=189691 RepID=UPI00196856A0|nr:type IV secretory system conjugative DNA transfer family protein [Paenibacillus elgii]
MKLHLENIPKNEDGAAAKEQNLPFSQGGIVVGMNKLRGKERIYCIQDDVHTLCLGATRSGKSRTVVLQSICTLGLAGESLVISDPKAELYHYTHEFLQKLNYDVYALDFRTPEKAIWHMTRSANALDQRSCRQIDWWCVTPNGRNTRT